MPPPQSLLQATLAPISADRPFASADVYDGLAGREMVFRQEYLGGHVAGGAGFCRQRERKGAGG